MFATAKTGKIGRGFGKNAGEWTGRVETGKEVIPGKKKSRRNMVLAVVFGDGFVHADLRRQSEKRS